MNEPSNAQGINPTECQINLTPDWQQDEEESNIPNKVPAILCNTNNNNNQTITTSPDLTTNLKNKPLNPEASTFIPTASTSFKEGDYTSPQQQKQITNRGIAEDQPGNQVETGPPLR